MSGDTPEYGMSMSQFSRVCPRCGALVYLGDEARAAHDAFHKRVEPKGTTFRRVDTPLGERIAYVPAGAELPAGWRDLGPYGEVPSGLSRESSDGSSDQPSA